MATIDGVIAESIAVVRAVALSPAVRADDDACAEFLGSVLGLEQGRFDSLSVGTDGGHTRCSVAAAAQPNPAPDEFHPASKSHARPDVDPVARKGLSEWPSIRLSAPLAGHADAGEPANLMAELDIKWLADTLASRVPLSGYPAWLVGPEERVYSARNATDDLLPATGELSRILAAQSSGLAVTAPSRTQMPFDYVSSRLRGDYSLLVGIPIAADLAEARAVLTRRLVELGLVFVGGLLAMAVGAERLIVRPFRRLSRSVRRWRDGGRFDPDLGTRASSEIVELASIFRSATDALAAREDQLQQTRAQQELLMQEIHHRVKNNLQVIASLLNLQASRIRVPEARAEFQAARDRIHALATLHRHLYAQSDVHTINMRSFLEEVCEQLVQTVGETPPGGRIRLDITAPELSISPDQAIPIALIVTEAVSNAAKYAFPSGRSGNIGVRLRLADGPDAKRTAVLSIEDDGIGIPDGRGGGEIGVRNGIGLHLIHGFVRQLGATLSIARDRGTQYRIEIPLPDGSAA